MTEIVITGAQGTMGREVLAAATGRDGIDVAFAANRDPADERIVDHPIRPAADLAGLLAEHAPAVVVDFTSPDSTAAYATACATAGVGFVTGTTGLGEDQRTTLDEAAERVPVLWATNFSRGIHALDTALAEIVGTLPDYDIELTETHHGRKRDAPSGTARSLLDRIDAASGHDHRRVYGREGEHTRENDEIGVHVRRAGTVRGEHEVLLAGDDEVLTLTHRAESRRVFAAGALDAAVWLVGRAPGRYEFREVLA